MKIVLIIKSINMLVNNEVKAKKLNQQVKELNQENKLLSSVVGIRVSNVQLEQLKAEAKKEKRSISNLIKSKLF